MDDDKDPAAVAIKALEKFIKILCYLIFANYAFEFIITLPPEIANRIFQIIFEKIGL